MFNYSVYILNIYVRHQIEKKRSIYKCNHGNSLTESMWNKAFIQIVKYEYTGWPRKNAATLIVNFKNIINKTELIFFFHYVENLFSNKMTP